MARPRKRTILAAGPAAVVAGVLAPAWTAHAVDTSVTVDSAR